MAPKSFFNASAQSDETQHGKKNDNKTDPPDNAVHIELLKMVKRLGYSKKMTTLLLFPLTFSGSVRKSTYHALSNNYSSKNLDGTFAGWVPV